MRLAKGFAGFCAGGSFSGDGVHAIFAKGFERAGWSSEGACPMPPNFILRGLVGAVASALFVAGS